MYKPLLGLAVLFVTSVPSSGIAAEPVTACGQRVKDGILEQDLDCSGDFQIALLVERSLSLNGHTITGLPSVINCVKPSHSSPNGKCTVIGPGVVRGADISTEGISGRKVIVDGVTFENLATGVNAVKATVSNCVMTGTFPDGFGGAMIGGARVTVTGTSIAAAAGWGVAGARRVVLVDSTVTGNRWDGVSGGRVELVNSSVTGNSLACDMPFFCGPAPTGLCSDVSARRIRLDGTSACDTSLAQEKYCPTSPLDYRPGPSLGVCAQD